MELGATELYFALHSADGAKNLPEGLPHCDPMDYLRQAARYAKNYITNIYDAGFTDTLNLYDVSGLAHFELYRAIEVAGDPGGLAVSSSEIRKQLLQQVEDAIDQADADPWGFGYQWSSGDTTSHGGGLSVMASEAHHLTQIPGALRLSSGTAARSRIVFNTRLRISREHSMELLEAHPFSGVQPPRVREVTSLPARLTA